MATWKKTPLVNTVKAKSGSTYKTGSSSVGYYGCDENDKYVADNACALVFDTSDFPSDSILKYKDCKLELHVNGTNKHMWLMDPDGYKSEEYSAKYEAYARSVEKAASTVATKSYSWLKENWVAQGDADGRCDGENAVFVASKFHHKTMVILLKKKLFTLSEYYCARVSQSGTYLKLTYNDIKPSATFTYTSGESYRAKKYKVSWKYGDSKNRGQAAWKLVWTSSSGKTGTVKGTTESSYTFPAYTFPAGDVTLTLSVKSGKDGVWSDGITNEKIITFINSEPNATEKAPTDGEQIYRALAQKFTWEYGDSADVAQGAYKITWQCGSKSGNTGKISNANKYHTFPAYTFPAGEVTYYLTVWNKDGITHKSGPYTLNAVNSIPSAEVTSPKAGENFNHYSELTVSWKYSDAANVAQKKFKITYTSGGVTKSVTGTTEKKYTFPAAVFAEGELSYKITVWNKDDVSYISETYIATCVMSIPTVTVKYPVTISVQRSRALTYSWDFDETYETGQKSWTLKATQNGNTKTYSGTTEQSLTVPAYTYQKGPVTYSITVTNNDGKTATTGNVSFNVETSHPSIELIYPNSVLVKGSEEQIFTWNYSETVDVGQKQYWIEVTQDGVVTEYTKVSSAHYHVFEPDTLPEGSSTFRIKVMNTDGEYAQIGPFILTVVSETEAPTITSVSNDAKPTITWITESQDGFEVIVADNYQNVLYESGFVIGSDTREYQVQELIPNGRYLIQLRVQNEYGYYTPYATKYVEISAVCKSEITNVTYYNTTDYGFAVEAGFSGGTAYIIRRDPVSMLEKNMGEYTGKYVDYTIPANTDMQYCIRLYDGGIVDSAWGIGHVQIKEVLIRSVSAPADYVLLELTDTENFNIYRSDARDKAKVKVLGREYEIMESSEWLNSTRRFRAYVTIDQFTKLMKYALSGKPIRYQAEKEYFMADIEITDEGIYVGGRMVSILVTRIDDGGE